MTPIRGAAIAAEIIGALLVVVAFQDRTIFASQTSAAGIAALVIGLFLLQLERNIGGRD